MHGNVLAVVSGEVIMGNDVGKLIEGMDLQPSVSREVS